MNEQYVREINGYKIKDEEAIRTYENVSSMKSDTKLTEGMYVKTRGYYNVNDGGNGEYIIRAKNNNDVEDNGFIHFIQNNLVGELVINNNTVNFKNLGAKPIINEKVDNKTYLNTYINKLSEIKNLKLYIPSGIWAFSETKIEANDINIFGDVNYYLGNNGTILVPYTDNQDYIITLGDSTSQINNINFKNLTFSSINYNASGVNSGLYSCEYLLRIIKVFGGFTDNLLFRDFNGGAFELGSSFELIFKNLNFRKGDNISKSIINFKENDVNSSISACDFQKIYFESVHGDLINVETNCICVNNHFGIINFEDYSYENGGTYTVITDNSYNKNTATHHNIIKINENCNFKNEIENIELNNFASKFYTLNNTQYVYDRIINVDYNILFSCIINNIVNVGCLDDITALYSHTGGYMGNSSSIVFNNLLMDNARQKYIFDVDGWSNIIINNNENLIIPTTPTLNQNFLPYRTNRIQRATSDSQHRGNVVYNENSINKNKLCIKLYDISVLPNANSQEVFVPLDKKYINIRALFPTDVSCNLNVQLKKISDNTSITTKYVQETGTGSFKWYNFDFSDSINEIDLGNVYVSIYPTSTNGSIILDTFM